MNVIILGSKAAPGSVVIECQACGTFVRMKPMSPPQFRRALMMFELTHEDCTPVPSKDA